MLLTSGFIYYSSEAVEKGSSGHHILIPFCYNHLSLQNDHKGFYNFLGISFEVFIFSLGLSHHFQCCRNMASIIKSSLRKYLGGKKKPNHFIRYSFSSFVLFSCAYHNTKIAFFIIGQP